jgi:tRNA dimethylallyltransferase
LRGRLERVADARGVESLHRWLSCVDAPSGARIQPRDRKRLIRALEVYLLTGRALSGHFADTVSPLPEADVLTIGLQVPRAELAVRVARRVDDQFARGIVHEVQSLIARGVPAEAHAFSGLVYRQVLELLQGVRDEPATRALIVRENLRYAKRQLTWFRKEPAVHWFDATSPDTHGRASLLIAEFLRKP